MNEEISKVKSLCDKLLGTIPWNDSAYRLMRYDNIIPWCREHAPDRCLGILPWEYTRQKGYEIEAEFLRRHRNFNVYELRHLRMGLANIVALYTGNKDLRQVSYPDMQTSWTLAWLPYKGGYVWEAAALTTPAQFAAILQEVAPSSGWVNLANTFQPEG